MTNSATRDAGDLAEWVRRTRSSLSTGAAADVPCGSCVACCRSAQFIHVTPHDESALSAIPPELLFAAPGLPPGHFVMGFTATGACPMLTDSGCSIYEARPQTCRMYDCRVFTVTSLDPRFDGKDEIAQTVDEWNFSVDAEGKALRRAATQAADFIGENDELSALTPSVTARAVAALRVLDLFVSPVGEEDEAGNHQPSIADVRAKLEQIP